MRTHRPCFILALVLAAGIIAGKLLPVPFTFWVILLCAVTIGAVFARPSWIIHAGVFALGAVLIINVSRLAPDSAAFLSYDDRQDIRMTEGIVDSKPQTRSWLQGEMIVFDLKVKRILTEQGWASQRGRIQVQEYQDRPLHYGQLLRV